MAHYNELNQLIDAYINRNGVQAITGQILNGVLKAMVEQLGRGYSIMGMALPDDDPGTPDAPETYFASTAGTYTNFGGITLQTAELAFLSYNPTGGTWTKETIYEGFARAEATIDNNTGTPSVDVSYTNGVLSFAFRNLKGATGPQGIQGPVGPAGVDSCVVTVDDTSGTPTATVSLVNGVLTIGFTGLKGAQGNSGYQGAADELQVVNNLTDGGATAALSAEMGKELDGKVNQLRQEVAADVSQLEAKVGYLKGTETDVPNTTVVLTNADVVAGETIYYKVTVPQGNAGALRFYDLDNTILLTAGNTATTTEKTYSGAFVVPANFKNAAIVWGSGLTINYIYTSRTNEELQKAIIATNGKFTELNKRVGIVIDSPVSYPAATAVFGTETAKAGDVMKASLTTVTGHVAILGLLDSNGNRLSYVGFGSAQSPNTTKEVYFTIPEGFATAKAEWGELKINYLYTELQNDILRKDIDSLSDHYKKAIEVIRYDDLTTVIQNYPWSGFIPLYDVESIIFSLKPLGNQGAAPVYFYKNGEASYADPLADADIKYTSYVKEGYYAKVDVPRGLHYMSFRSNHDTDFVILIHTSKDKSVDDRNLKEIVDRSSVISDGFIPACGEPNLLYDPQRGIVYENYICGDSFGGDPGGNFGFAKFPLNQPERAIYKRAVTFGTTLVDGHPVTFRDTLWYWKTPYSVIRGITYGYSEDDNVWGLHYFDMDTDGNISNFTLIKWSDDSIVNYDNNIAKLIAAGITPYYSATLSAPESDHYKQLWPSSTHIQEYGGYKYFTLNMTRDCPMICRTNDDFATIEVVKAFQIKGDYEAVLVINGTDWYYLVRTQGQTYSLYYAYSEDAGATWSAFTGVIGAANSKPRGFMYGGKVLFLVPLVGLPDFPASGYTGTEDNIAASIRYVATMLRGDKDTDINDWERPIVAVSKYGQNYGDILAVGKVLYYAWSCDETHLDNLPVSGKSQIRFTRIGNLDNTSVFGDF